MSDLLQLFLSRCFRPCAWMRVKRKCGDKNNGSESVGDSSPHNPPTFIMDQMILPIFASHVSSDPFNLTSFSVISDPSGYETIEWDDEGGYAGGGVHWTELW